MENRKPTLEDWKGLYEAARDFRKIESWRWVADSDLFGVQNPATGEVSYCCIMGMAEEVYGLSAYSGSEGLAGYLKVECGDVSPEDVETMFIQDSLTLFYEDRDAVQQEDREVIKGLGLKFRGRNAWPLFRQFKPGYHPWFFTREEVLFFKVLLEQATDVVLRFKEDKKLLSSKSRDRYFVRVPCEGEGSIAWRDEWLKPAPIRCEEVPLGQVDEVRIRRIRSKVPERQGALEIDCFLTPAPVQENPGERPFYPDAAVVIDHGSGIVTDLQLANLSERGKTVQEAFLHHIETVQSVPKEVFVRKDDVLRFLEPLADRLGVNLSTTGTLKHMDNFKHGLFHQVIGGR